MVGLAAALLVEVCVLVQVVGFPLHNEVVVAFDIVEHEELVPDRPHLIEMLGISAEP
jgi:hypothetical protein